MLVMSSDGPLGAYLNSSGFVSGILIMLIANGLALAGNPVEDYSWFPGYGSHICFSLNLSHVVDGS